MALSRGNCVVRTGPLTFKTKAALTAIKHLTKVCTNDFSVYISCNVSALCDDILFNYYSFIPFNKTTNAYKPGSFLRDLL